MSGWLAVLCEISGCEEDPQTGLCKRCGRVNRVEKETSSSCKKTCAQCGHPEASEIAHTPNA
jgi:ribosomal protein L37E